MTLGQIHLDLNKAQEAETHLNRALLCRVLLEEAVNFIYHKVGAKKPSKASLLELLDSPVVTGYINDADTVNSLHYVRILGMNARHGRKVRKNEAKLAQENITYLIGLLVAKESGTEYACHKPPYMSEAELRKISAQDERLRTFLRRRKRLQRKAHVLYLPDHDQLHRR